MAPCHKRRNYIRNFLADLQEHFLLMAGDGERAFFLKFDFLHVLNMNLENQSIVKEGPEYTKDATDDDGPGGCGKGQGGLAKGGRGLDELSE